MGISVFEHKPNHRKVNKHVHLEMDEYIPMKPPLIMRLCCFSLSYVLKNYNNYSKGLVDIIGSQVTYTETHRNG